MPPPSNPKQLSEELDGLLRACDLTKSSDVQGVIALEHKMASSIDDWKPRIGLEFDSIEAAWQFWLTYSAHVGFGVRKRYTNKRKKDGSICSCRFVCSKEGLRAVDKRDALVSKHRPETRTDCKARISLVLNNGKLVIHEFVKDHNHPLQLVETTNMLASHRKIIEVQADETDMADDSGLRQKSSFQLMSTHAGHSANLGHTQLDVKNYLSARGQRIMVYGEAGCLLQYFQRQLLEKLSFFHAYQMDMDEKITNVFWADVNMVLDYEYFGDVILLDTTYCTNFSNRPLALFSGFNHYRGSVIFGAALLYDKTIESFKWLFETFLQAHHRKKPQTIFTDQDQAVARALAVAEVMPEPCHSLCTWQLLQNGINNLGNLMKESHFLRDFRKCMYDFDTEAEFETTWTELIAKCNAHEKEWMKSVYDKKEKWVSCYLKEAFTLGMRNTQSSESLNSNFESCMKLNVDIIHFFRNFERAIEEIRGNELTCEYESVDKLAMLRYELSPILIQMAKVYTHVVFDLFQKEFMIFLALCISERNESRSLCQYVITRVNHEGSWIVSFDRASTSISCSCRKFETFGILCSHALKVFEANDVKVVPEKYILRRWTREARCGIVYDMSEKEVEGDPKLSSTQRLRQIVSKFIRLAAEVSPCDEYHKIVDDGVGVMCKQIMELRLQARNIDNLQPKGFKQQPDLKSHKRLKSSVERSPTRGQLHSRQASQDKKFRSHQLDRVSCSASAAYEPSQTQEDQFSFTECLMAPHDDRRSNIR